ncbi:MAG: cytochrome c biogenesis protein CcsA [Sulfurospirillum sp.]|nr:cytochrome c biogenesis protein CcsA [Sulfurospirillum sp.]
MKFFMKNILSMKMAVIFLLLFAAVSGIATFIENDFGIDASWSVVYNATWFAIIQVMLGLMIINNMFKYNVFQKNKIPALMFHLGFIVILIGSGITRYMGYEGSLHIREGGVENRVVSSESFVTINAQKDETIYNVSKKKIISTIGFNNFSMNLDVDGDTANIKYKEFIPNATTDVVESVDGEPMISMMVSSGEETKKVILKNNKYLSKTPIYFTLNLDSKSDYKSSVNITIKDEKFYFISDQKIGWFKMSDSSKGVYEENKEHEFTNGKLYSMEDINFAPIFIGLKGKEKIVTNEHSNKKNERSLFALIVDLTFKGTTEEVAMYGMGKGAKGYASSLNIDGVDFNLEWGSLIFELPFFVKLNDFQLDRYPGSSSPMSYASEIEVIDEDNNVNLPFRVYMNHVLDYSGFRFFQSSYDLDEKGTILTVNRDPGKWPTYIGYMLLSLGFLLNIINPKSRFRKLANMIQKDMDRVKPTLIAFLMIFGLLQSGELHANEENLKFLKKYDKAHADKFGEILVQSADGRIKPIDTISTEVLNKVYRKSSFKGMSANQVMLSMMVSPMEWQTQPMIHVFHSELKELLGIDKNKKKATFNDFFETSGEYSYKLEKYAEEANRKKPALRNKFDKDVIKVDERVNICYYVYTGEIFKMIPKIGDPNNKWHSPKSAISHFSDSESMHVRSLLTDYFKSIDQGLESGDWSSTDNAAQNIKSYQKQYASNIMPSPSRISAEILFNRAEVFQKLTPLYLLSGLILLFAIFTKMIKTSISLKLVTKIVFVLVLFGFAIHTFGLGLRWYIAGHAPWSNGYESMIYIAWSLALAGLFFSRQSIVSLALTSILAGVTLFVAHLSWMDPQITTLIPVLDSYWLNIHVSVITASYGFFGLCSLLGLFTLIMFIIKKTDEKSKRNDEIERNIVEATRINEMSMILGLSLLSVGNFLGGVWANESWGRYWGWDPKETWSLVSILIYAAIVHFRFIKTLNTQFAFAVSSTIAFASIIMTYFGVNFYLSGMHSYASGDPVPVPVFVYYTVAVVCILIALAWRNRNLSKTL